MSIRDLLVSEWCVGQQVGHFETLGEWLDDTRSKLLKGEAQEWQLIGVYDDEMERAVEYDKFAEKMIGKIPDKDKLPITLI